MVSLIDVILIIILASFVFYGLFLGLIRTIGSLAGFVIGLWAASHFYLNLYSWCESIFLGHSILGKILSFIVLFAAVRFLVVFTFSLLNKAFNLLAIIPFMKLFNRIGGAIFGFLEGSLIIGVIFLVARHYQILNSLVEKILTNSKIGPVIIKIANLITPLIPEILDKVKRVV